MKIDDFLHKRCEWLSGTGPESDIAISTRVRIARNVEGRIYFTYADESERKQTLNMLFSAMKRCDFLKNAYFFKINDLTEVDRQFFIERHLMSREHTHEVINKGLVVDKTEMVSAMLNEEDHLRLQVLKSGFDIMEAWRIVDEIENDLCRYLSFDYLNKFGYLTSCPTNTGTGLRVSVMLHLSALVLSGQIDNVFDALSKLGITIRGFYGEGTEALGDFFQISNQTTMGHSEMDLIDSIYRMIRKIIDREKGMRSTLIAKRRKEITDRVQKSYETLKKSSIITSNETIKLLSSVRLGVSLGLVEGVDTALLNEVLLCSQPAHLQKMQEKAIVPFERDIKRADFLREKFC